jgi:hypothetical protein
MRLNLKAVKSVKTGKRLEQIEKVANYAKNILGVNVSFVDNEKIGHCSGEYEAPIGGKKAVVLVSNNLSGLSTLLTLLHELGHHIDLLKRGSIPIEEEAYRHYPDDFGIACPIKYRKHIKNIENHANYHAWEIARYLDLRLPVFTYIKDVLFQQESLNYTLANGYTPKKIRDKLWKKCHKKARRLVCQLKNPLSLLFVIR